MNCLGSDKKYLLRLTATLAIILMSACNDGPGSSGESMMGSTDAWSGSEKNSHAASETAQPVDDWGADWANVTRSNSSSGTRDNGRAGTTDGPRTGRIWSVVLRTFSGEGHETQAGLASRGLSRIDPGLSRVWVHSTAKGSMILYGRYEGPDDPQLNADVQWARAMQINGKPAFHRVLKAPINLGRSAGRRSPYDLANVRDLYPTVNPLYTLQVGVWGSFEGAMAWDRAKSKAESRVRELRARRLTAYVYHLDDRELSMVTIGVFDRTAMNAQSGLYSDEVEALLRQFPEHLVNGEPVKQPGKGMQKPMLVIVP